MYIYIYIWCVFKIYVDLYTCLCWVSLFRCWNRWSFIQILGQVLLFLLPLTPFRLGVRGRWSVDTHTKGTYVYCIIFHNPLFFFSNRESKNIIMHQDVTLNKPFFGVLLLALLRWWGWGGWWRALPLLGAARFLVPPLVWCGHLICQGLGGDPLPLRTALSNLIVLLVHPLVILVQI